MKPPLSTLHNTPPILGHHRWTIHSPIGLLGISTDECDIIGLRFLIRSQDTDYFKCFGAVHLTPIIQRAIDTLEQYFLDPFHRPTCSFKLTGSALQQYVLKQLQKIPCGATLTYSQFAKEVSSQNTSFDNVHPRTIGQICRSNPIPLIIPCHRIISAKDVGGFCGQKQGPLIQIKKWLLNHERQFQKAY